MNADTPIGDESLEFNLMQTCKLASAAQSDALLLEEGDREFGAKVCFSDLQSIGKSIVICMVILLLLSHIFAYAFEEYDGSLASHVVIGRMLPNFYCCLCSELDLIEVINDCSNFTGC